MNHNRLNLRNLPMPIKALLVGGGFAIAGCGGANVEPTAEHVSAANTPVAAGKPGHPSELHKKEHPEAIATTEATSTPESSNADQYAAAVQGVGNAYAREGGQTAVKLVENDPRVLQWVQQRGLTPDQFDAVVEDPNHTTFKQDADTHLEGDTHSDFPGGKTIPQGMDVDFTITP